MRASERVYSSLKDDILAWRLTPGTELSEVDQAVRLGVSRTPLREALTRLTAEGLATPGRGRTLVVSDLSPGDLRHLYELREALETQAARLAARRRSAEVFARLRTRFADASALLDGTDPERTRYYALVADLDRAVDHAMGSPYLHRALATVRSHAARARRLSRDNPARLEQAAREHLLIVQAILDGDETLAAQATAVHLRMSLATILASLAAGPTEGAAEAPSAGAPS